MKNYKLNIIKENNCKFEANIGKIKVIATRLRGESGVKGFIATEKARIKDSDKYHYPAVPKLFKDMTKIFDSIASVKRYVQDILLLSQAQFKIDGIYYAKDKKIVWVLNNEIWEKSKITIDCFMQLISDNENVIVGNDFNEVFSA